MWRDLENLQHRTGVRSNLRKYERRFVMTFPNETLPKGGCRKPLRYMTGLSPKVHGWDKVLA